MVTVLNGQYKTYTGRRSLTVSNTAINSGGNATFTSQKSIILLPGFIADAGSHVSIYIAPPDCNEMPLREELAENMLANTKDFKNFIKDHKEIKLFFETDFSENYIILFPNPTNSTITVQLHSNNSETSLISIKLMDLMGREILSQKINGQSHVLDVSTCPKGIYFLEAKDETNSYYQKLIIQ
jgi:hypothetical protein